jgi:hypothetical protein
MARGSLLAGLLCAALMLADGPVARAEDASAGDQPPPGSGPTPATPSAASSSSSASSNAPVKLEAVVVKESAEGSVLPTDQTVTSVLGTDLSVQDTPRTVTVLSQELMQNANITDITSFEKIAPSAYTTVPFGFASVPAIRGQFADVFINGMERTTRGDGPPTSFNAVEQSDIVSGPPSAVLGPTANTGGYVNFVTKQPYFDTFHSDSVVTFGSYDERMYTEDIGGPLIPNVLAYRVSAEVIHSGSYYEDVKTDTQDVYTALAWTPNKDLRVDFDTEFYDGRFDENTGLDRPTQQLIDGFNYSTGLFSAYGVIDGGNPNGSSSGYPSFGSFGGLINSPGTVKISPTASEVGPDDGDFSKDFYADLTETFKGTGSFSFINRSYYEYLMLRNYEIAQLYTNLQYSRIFQDRAEAHLDLGGPWGTKNQIVTGVAFRSVDITGYGDYFNESLNATDLTTNFWPVEDNQYNGSNYYTLGNVPGTNFRATTGLVQPNTTAETATEESVFFQHQLTINPQWTFIYGIRADLIHDNLSDPIPNNPASGDGLPADAGVHDVTNQLLGTGDASITFKPFPWVTTYATFDFNQSTAGNPGGGFDTFSDGGVPQDYHYDNYLYEVGSKFSLFNKTLYLTVDGFWQMHNVTTTLDSTTAIRAYGAEISTTYQPNKQFNIILNESCMVATIINPGAELTGNVYDVFSTSSVGVAGTGFGAPNFTAQPPGDYVDSGFPRYLFTGLTSYTFKSGLGAVVSYMVTSPIATSELGNVLIPWQHELDVALFYTHKHFTFRLTFFNVTNQYNFSTGGYLSSAGNDVISVSEPFHMEGSVGYKF